MNHRPEGVAVVVAWDDAPRSPDETLARFAAEAGPRGEVIVVDASPRGSASGPASRLANVRVLRRPPGLVPALWRDGLLAAGSPLVAFSTSRMLPGPGWLTKLAAGLVETGASGIGGPIAPGDRLSATDRAVALLRYSNYFPPLGDPERFEPPGENALYRRDRLFEIQSVWADGFWEAEVHRALRRDGHRLAIRPDAVVSFEGGSGLLATLGQRWAHARRYGADRSAGLSALARLGRAARAPLVPPLLASRIVARLRAKGMSLAPWSAAWPALALLATAWAAGEAIGTFLGEPARRADRSFNLAGRGLASGRQECLPHQALAVGQTFLSARSLVQQLEGPIDPEAASPQPAFPPANSPRHRSIERTPDAIS